MIIVIWPNYNLFNLDIHFIKKNYLEDFLIRKIKPSDEISLARIIRSCLEEFNTVKQGTVYDDDTTDHLFDVFKAERSCYFVIERDDAVYGGAGIYPTNNLPQDTCELVKMYLLPQARGKGIAKRLLQKCMAEGKNQGFAKMYLESMPELVNAIAMYEKNGFEFIKGPLGNSGHTGCEVFMMKDL